MNDLRELVPSREQQEKLERLIKKSPSPALASTNLARLIETGGPACWKKFPATSMEPLIRLLGGSPFLSHYLIRKGKGWREHFLKQIKINQKSVANHLAELAPLLITWGES